MMDAQYTPGPWFRIPHDREGSRFSIAREVAPSDGINPPTVAIVAASVAGVAEPDGRLLTASPAMVDAIKGLIGLCQLVRNRGDLPAEARLALTHNHRIIAAYEALSAAGVEGFQPSDFDAHKTADAA